MGEGERTSEMMSWQDLTQLPKSQDGSKKLSESVLSWGKPPVPSIKTCIGNCPGLGKSARKHWCQSALELLLATKEGCRGVSSYQNQISQGGNCLSTRMIKEG